MSIEEYVGLLEELKKRKEHESQKYVPDDNQKEIKNFSTNRIIGADYYLAETVPVNRVLLLKKYTGGPPRHIPISLLPQPLESGPYPQNIVLYLKESGAT